MIIVPQLDMKIHHKRKQNAMTLVAESILFLSLFSLILSKFIWVTLFPFPPTPVTHTKKEIKKIIGNLRDTNYFLF